MKSINLQSICNQFASQFATNMHLSQSLSLISFITRLSSVISFFISQTNNYHQSKSRKNQHPQTPIIHCTHVTGSKCTIIIIFCTANILHSSQSSSFFILNALLHTLYIFRMLKTYQWNSSICISVNRCHWSHSSLTHLR